MPRNPNWTPDELILALDLYFRVEIPNWSANHPEVIELSRFLNSLPIHSTRHEGFRNPASVYMKLCNFLRFDPDYPGVGLPAGSRLEEEIWTAYVGDRSRLRKIASLIRESSASGILQEKKITEEYGALEGQILTRLHSQRERSPGIVEKKKAETLRVRGRLACEVCGFDFEKCYGELGRGFAECHHLVPLTELSVQSRTRLQDLAVVCANCHRMLHRGFLTIEGLQARINTPPGSASMSSN